MDKDFFRRMGGVTFCRLGRWEDEVWRPQVHSIQGGLPENDVKESIADMRKRERGTEIDS